MGILFYSVTFFLTLDEEYEPLNSPSSHINSTFVTNFDFRQHTLLIDKMQSIYPFDLPLAAWLLHNNWQGSMRIFKALPPMQAHTVDEHTPDIIMLVIGESARRDHWNLYGYERNTTPFMSSRQTELLRFDNMISQSVATRNALSAMLSRYPVLRSDGKQSNQVERSIIAAFNQAGYQTWWISNQGQSGWVDNPITLLANDAKQIYFINSNDHNTTGRWDEALLPYVERALSEPTGKKMLVVHLMGSHFNYGHRYPEQFAQFTPHLSNKWLPNQTAKSDAQKVINSYDNSILYTDYILDRLLQTLQQFSNKNILFLYISDHGEDLKSEILTSKTGSCEIKESSRSSYRAYQIPFIMWASPAYISAHPDRFQKMTQAQNQAWRQDVVPQTLLDLAGITIQGNARTPSILDTVHPQMYAKRAVSTASGERNYEAAMQQSPCNLSGANQ